MQNKLLPHSQIYCICRPFHTKTSELKHTIFRKIIVFGPVGTIRSISKLRTSTSFEREWIWTLNQTLDQKTCFNILDLNSSFAEFFYQKNSMLLVSLRTMSAKKCPAWRGIVEEKHTWHSLKNYTEWVYAMRVWVILIRVCVCRMMTIYEQTYCSLSLNAWVHFNFFHVCFYIFIQCTKHKWAAFARKNLLFLHSFYFI